MKYKYNISYKESGKKTNINFNSKNKMIEYLSNNTVKVNSLDNVYINFNQISLPLKATIWTEKK